MAYNAKQSFEKFAPEYLKYREQDFDNELQLSEIVNRCKSIEGKKVLELGCGGGLPVLKYFSDRGANISGVDFSPSMINAAKKNLPKGEFILCDINNIALENESYDVILSFYALFVLKVHEQFVVFKKIYDALQQGGVTCFTLLSKAATNQDEFSGFINFMGYDFLYEHTSVDNYKAHLNDIGFKNIKLEEVTVGPETCLWVFAEK